MFNRLLITIVGPTAAAAASLACASRTGATATARHPPVAGDAAGAEMLEQALHQACAANPAAVDIMFASAMPISKYLSGNAS